MASLSVGGIQVHWIPEVLDWVVTPGIKLAS